MKSILLILSCIISISSFAEGSEKMAGAMMLEIPLDRMADSSLQLRPLLATGPFLGNDWVGLYFLGKIGISLAGVGNNSNDFSLLKAFRVGGGLDLAFSLPTNKNFSDIILGVDQIYNLERDAENGWETSYRLSFGGRPVWDGQTSALYAAFGAKVAFLKTGTDRNTIYGVFFQIGGR